MQNDLDAENARPPLPLLPVALKARTNKPMVHGNWAARTIALCLLNLVCAGGAFSSITVSSGGQASTGYPIAVPAGVAGMAPNLGLSFSDGGINGPVGVGWSLQGISMITRCAATRPTDGIYRNVEFSTSDKLCLDGQRLIQTDASGSVAASQTDDALGVSSGSREFRTEKDSFARIRAYGISGAAVANGPSSFKVWTKSGQVYEYGLVYPYATPTVPDANAVINVQGSAVVAVWAVKRISDVVGNYMEFIYARPADLAWGSGVVAGGASGSEWNLAEVRYTGRGVPPVQAPHNRVVFEYEQRDATALPGHDRSEAYQWANKNISVQRLKAIRTFINSPNGVVAGAVPVRTIKLEYERSPVTGRSRLTKIRDCSGANESKCLPPTVYTYSNTTAVAFASSTAFGATTFPNKKLLDATSGNYGILTGDFNGDGRTDILRWGNNQAENELWLSKGDGTFTNVTGSDIASIRFFSSDGCYSSTVTDFNGDGVSDILRIAKSGCAGGNQLFRGKGDGTFLAVALPSTIDLEQIKAGSSSRSTTCISQNSMPAQTQAVKASEGSSGVSIPIDTFGGVALTPPALKQPKLSADITSGNCFRYIGSLGKRFYIMDVDGDGIQDIVTTVLPSYDWNSGWGRLPSWEERCALTLGSCTRVFKGDAAGGFTEMATNVASTTLYSTPGGNNLYQPNPYWRAPDLADINGDGLQDILSDKTGRWRSLGNGNFAAGALQDDSQLCALPIDFNGDGRTDCLRPEKNSPTPGTQLLQLSYGANSSGALLQFNLTSYADRLYDLDTSSRQTVGAVVADFDGDGRQDILRWGSTATSENGIYLSNGDGSFRARVAAGLDTVKLQAADGSLSFVMGDFLGIGAVQMLRLASNPPASGGTPDAVNQLWVPTGGNGPVDVLERVTSPTGLVSEVKARVLLTAGVAADGSGYAADTRGLPSTTTPAIIDLQPPMYVVSSTRRQTGPGQTLTTKYRYAGLKAERGGRGLLGFREMQQQDETPDPAKPLTVATDFLLKHPYSGTAWRTRTFVGALGQTSGMPLSSAINTYCDRTSPDNPDAATETTPCVTTAKVTRPYLRKSVEEGSDLNGALLPKITTVNSFNDFGDPLTISVSSEANFQGANRVHTKITSNEFCVPGSTLPSGGACPNNTAGDAWILGRLTRASVTATAPNMLSLLSASPGTSATATAVKGVAPSGSVQPLNPAVLSVVLQLLLED